MSQRSHKLVDGFFDIDFCSITKSIILSYNNNKSSHFQMKKINLL
jgi:hypothetical protein